MGELRDIINNCKKPSIKCACSYFSVPAAWVLMQSICHLHSPSVRRGPCSLPWLPPSMTRSEVIFRKCFCQLPRLKSHLRQASRPHPELQTPSNQAAPSNSFPFPLPLSGLILLQVPTLQSPGCWGRPGSSWGCSRSRDASLLQA